MRIQDFQRFRDINLIQPQRAQLVMQGFALAPATWAGASVILAEYPIGNSYWFSFKLPVKAFGSNFVLAVRYVEDGIAFRYKFWEDDGEILFYPVYGGERLGPNAVLELWSVDYTDMPQLLADKTFLISVLSFPPQANCSSCCENVDSVSLLIPTAPTIISAYAYGNSFCTGLCVP